MPGFAIDLDVCLNSGQVFLWEKLDDVWYGVNGDDILAVEDNPLRIKSFFGKTYDLFRENDDFEKILESINKDKLVKSATKRFSGLRLLRQDPFQCYISFIASSNSNIPKIKQILFRLCKKFGQKIRISGNDFYLFPEPKTLGRLDMAELQSCGLGYRSKSVKIAAQDVMEGRIDFDYLKKLKYFEIKNHLLNVFGIGNKVADCIMLFSLEKLEAFPLDRWMLGILKKYYSEKFDLEIKSLTEKKYQSLHEEIVDYFGPYAGYSQQFLFKMERDLYNKRWL